MTTDLWIWVKFHIAMYALDFETFNQITWDGVKIEQSTTEFMSIYVKKCKRCSRHNIGIEWKLHQNAKRRTFNTSKVKKGASFCWFKSAVTTNDHLCGQKDRKLCQVLSIPTKYCSVLFKECVMVLPRCLATRADGNSDDKITISGLNLSAMLIFMSSRVGLSTWLSTLGRGHGTFPERAGE